MISLRIIRLRRPPTLTLQDTPFVPRLQGPHAKAMDVMDEVDRRWMVLRNSNPSLYDGRLCHVLGVHRNGHGGASIHTADCAYRFHAVQTEQFDLGVRHLGVKGVTIQGGRLLLGRRAAGVLTYPGMWEFAPGGVVEPGHDPAEVAIRELQEECGLASAAVPTPIAIVFDATARCWEIVFRMHAEARRQSPRSDEYSELRWCEPGHWPGQLSPVARQIANLV